MKNIRIINKQLAFLLAFSFFFQYNLLAQDEPNIIPRNAKGFAEYMEVVQVDSVSKSELYLTALEWMNKTYKSGKSVIQTADNNGGMIIGKANTQTVIYNNMGIMKDGGYFSYTISIYCKDNRYKYVIDNITYNAGDMLLNPGADLGEDFPSNWTGMIMKNKQTKREWRSFQKQVNTELVAIITDLKRSMSEVKINQDW